MTADLQRRLWKLAGTLGWAAIIVLSLVPSQARPHSGYGGIAEHFVAYAAVSFCLFMAFARPRNHVLLAALLIAGSALLEVAQMSIPGRTAEIAGVTSALGGVAAGFCVAWAISRLKG